MSTNLKLEKNKILNLLASSQIKDAIESLTRLSVNVQDWHISEKLSNLDMTYRYMLRYQFEGTEDPDRQQVYNNILRTLYELTDDITDEISLIESSNIFYEKMRINSLRTPITINEYKKQLIAISEEQALTDLLDNGVEKQVKKRDLAVKRERIGSDMFNSVFIAGRADDPYMEDSLGFINSVELPVRDRALFVSALMLNLVHRFDYRKVQVLMSACQSDLLIIRQRAIVGLILVLQMYDDRWNLYPSCSKQLESLTEDVGFRKSVLAIVKQIIRSHETEKITRKLNEEIYPEMMKFSSKAKRKLNMDDIMGDGDFSEKNPEWKKELEESGLADKLQEFSNMQLEGTDVFHSAFSKLKNFSFFGELSNWFLPYDPAYSELLQLNLDDKKDNLLYTAILKSGHMCNSDKYSFSLSLLQIPASQREMMMMQFGAESDEIKKMQEEAMAVNPNLDEEIVSNQYIQDLYRFFKLYPYRNSFFDVFTLKLNFYDIKSLEPLISEMGSMKQIAAYCFDKDLFDEALTIYKKLAYLEESSNTWQRIGYCYQMQNDVKAALEAYEHADLLSQDNSWTLKRIAQSYRLLKHYEKAIEYYEKAVQLKPNDMSVAINIGHCYLELKEYEKALEQYFKVEMLSEKNAFRAWRPIAWTSFMMQRFDLSKKYYDLVLANKPNAQDYLNAGHVELCQSNFPQAVALYKSAIEKENGDVDKFILQFAEDEDDLIHVGADKVLFPLLFDQLRYEFD